MSVTGWFANSSDKEHFDDFFNQREREVAGYLNGDIRRYAYILLFGEVDDARYDCEDICNVYRREECSQRESEFCKQKTTKSKRNPYKTTNYYVIWKRMAKRLRDRETQLRKVVGDHRYESFMEFLTHLAKEEFSKYTRREIKENKMDEPELFHSALTTFEDVQNDPWQSFLNNKIMKGDLACLNFSDSLFSV